MAEMVLNYANEVAEVEADCQWGRAMRKQLVMQESVVAVCLKGSGVLAAVGVMWWLSEVLGMSVWVLGGLWQSQCVATNDRGARNGWEWYPVQFWAYNFW